jgi:hypothetical protein
LNDPNIGFIKLYLITEPYLSQPLVIVFCREDDSRWALEVSKIPAITAEFEKTVGRPRLLSPSGGTCVRMTRVRDDIKVAYPNLKNVSDRWSSSDHPAFSNIPLPDCNLVGVLVLLSDKLYLLEENKKVIIQQFELQHLWMTPINKTQSDWIIMTPSISVFIKFQTQRDSELVYSIAHATKELLSSPFHLNNLRIQIASHTRSLSKSDHIPAALIQIGHIKAPATRSHIAAAQLTDKDAASLSPKQWWDSFFAPTRFVVFLYNSGGSTGDVYIGNMTCCVRSGWGIFMCSSVQRFYSCFWRHDRPNGFGRVTECNAAGSDVSFCGFFEGGQFGPGQPVQGQSGGFQSMALGHLVQRVTAAFPANIISIFSHICVRLQKALQFILANLRGANGMAKGSRKILNANTKGLGFRTAGAAQGF